MCLCHNSEHGSKVNFILKLKLKALNYVIYLFSVYI